MILSNLEKMISQNSPYLFCWQCVDIVMRTCFSITLFQQDILAVGYGEFVFSEQKGGLACCWSIKNPEVTEPVNQTFYFVKRQVCFVFVFSVSTLLFYYLRDPMSMVCQGQRLLLVLTSLYRLVILFLKILMFRKSLG